jgi:hypothetical protein
MSYEKNLHCHWQSIHDKNTLASTNSGTPYISMSIYLSSSTRTFLAKMTAQSCQLRAVQRSPLCVYLSLLIIYNYSCV